MNRPRNDSMGDVEESIRKEYQSGSIYKADTICNTVKQNAQEYIDRLLEDKLDTVRRHVQRGLLLDLCCATGGHLFALANISPDALGIDFSVPFIEKAKQDAAAQGYGHLRFEVADAKALPLADASVATLYSFSALYAIPGVDAVFKEIGRVLKPGGRCILDLGNSRSINSYCVRAYTELPPTFHLSVAEMQALCAANGLRIVEHRRFQILPLWAGKPRWLWPLLHPRWKRIMSRRIGKRMLDEHLSSLPLLRRFAFRHLIVAEKC